MSLVSDVHDSQGMFSKAGRFTSEKYIIFQKKEEILLNKPRYVKGSTMMEEKHETAPKTNTAHQSVQNAQLQKDQAEKKQRRHENQPFSKQPSREKLAKIRTDKNQPPPCGYYHPKYFEIDTKPHLVFDYQKQQQLTSSRLANTQSTSELTLQTAKSIPERMRKTNTCLYELGRQLPRGDSLFKGNMDPHEKRFEFLTVTGTWSKVPRTPQVPMEKILSRDQMLIYKKKNYAPDYQPNFEFGRRGLGSCGASFDKLEKRKDIFFKKLPYTNETYFEFDKYSKQPNSNLFHQEPVPDFNRMLDREQDSKCMLPSFMQKFVNMRMTLSVPHQKMLEVNNFRDGRFQTMTSTFGKYKTATKRKASLSEDDIDMELIDQ